MDQMQSESAGETDGRLRDPGDRDRDEPKLAGRRYSRNYSGTYGREGRNESRYSRNGYSRGVDWNEHLRMMMDEAPDEATRMDIKKLMDRMAG